MISTKGMLDQYVLSFRAGDLQGILTGYDLDATFIQSSRDGARDARGHGAGEYHTRFQEQPTRRPPKHYPNRPTRTGCRTAQVVHIAAHTDTDSVVYFPDANVLAVGDTGGPNRYPNMDVGGGGTIDGTIAGVQVYLNMANDQTKIVPGNGPLYCAPCV